MSLIGWPNENIVLLNDYIRTIELSGGRKWDITQNLNIKRNWLTLVTTYRYICEWFVIVFVNMEWNFVYIIIWYAITFQIVIYLDLDLV